MDAVILSDLHLGSDLCQAGALSDFLERVRSGRVAAGELILNGDVLDSHDFRRFRKSHWKALSLLRKLSDDMKVRWITGNHDGPADTLAGLLGIDVCDRHLLSSGGKSILCLHGHQFDKFIDAHPILTRIADGIYSFLQKIDPSHRLPRIAKYHSKTFLRCAELVKRRALREMKKAGCDLVCCGHTHHAAAELPYLNSGCWTEKPCTFLEIKNGEASLREWN